MIPKRRVIGNDIISARPTHTPRQVQQPSPAPAPRQQMIPPRTSNDTRTATRATPKPPGQPLRKGLVKPRRKSFRERFQLPIIILGGIVLGFMAQSAILGQLLVVAYGIACLLWKVASRTTFILATLTFVAMILVIATQNNNLTAQNFASYAFLLLLVGIITSAREMREQRLLHSKKRGAERYAHTHK